MCSASRGPSTGSGSMFPTRKLTNSVLWQGSSHPPTSGFQRQEGPKTGGGACGSMPKGSMPTGSMPWSIAAVTCGGADLGSDRLRG